MYIKIFFGDKPLFLCDSIDGPIEAYIHHDDAIFIDELDSHMIKTIIHEMQEAKVHAGVFFHSDLNELKTAFFKKFTLIKAAGGLVTNKALEKLLIFRRGKWDLPKGKLEDGEKIEECAIREVEEETGLTNVELVSPLLITYHTYHEGSKFILKESHWYNMLVEQSENLKPQTEEDITEAKWVKQPDLHKYKENCFPSVVDVLEA